MSTNSLKKLGITEGDDMFFVGLFTPFYGSKENLPICRFGHLAMLPDEAITVNGVRDRSTSISWKPGASGGK